MRLSMSDRGVSQTPPSAINERDEREGRYTVRLLDGALVATACDQFNGEQAETPMLHLIRRTYRSDEVIMIPGCSGLMCLRPSLTHTY